LSADFMRRLVVLRQVVVDGSLDVTDAGVSVPPDALRLDLGEEAFDQVQSGCAGRREVELEAQVLLQPSVYFGHLMRGVVVEH
jgi:hypothetical protein